MTIKNTVCLLVLLAHVMLASTGFRVSRSKLTAMIKKGDVGWATVLRSSAYGTTIYNSARGTGGCSKVNCRWHCRRRHVPRARSVQGELAASQGQRYAEDRRRDQLRRQGAPLDRGGL